MIYCLFVDNLPPPPSYEAAIQEQPPPNVDQKYPTYPTQAPYPQQQYAPPHQYPQQPYPGNPPSGQYPQNPNMPAPGVVGYGPGYPMNTPGYNYNNYSGSVAPNGTPVNPYLGAVSICFFVFKFSSLYITGTQWLKDLKLFLGLLNFSKQYSQGGN